MQFERAFSKIVTNVKKGKQTLSPSPYGFKNLKTHDCDSTAEKVSSLSPKVSL